MATTDTAAGLDHPTVVPENFEPDGHEAESSGERDRRVDGRE